MTKSNHGQLDIFEEADYPEGVYKKLHPAFKGRCRVLKPKAKYSEDDPHYTVDLDKGECSCAWGHAWFFDADKKRWRENMYCVHKLRAMASIVEKHDYDPELVQAYVRALRTRYNVYEVTSAFHKELRRGDVKEALFWGALHSAFRGLKGTMKYMLQTIYEETRDHQLARWLFNHYHDTDEITVANVCKAIELYCKSPKKWELPHRLDIFDDEMQAYHRLVEEFGKQIARGGDVVPFEMMDRFKEELAWGIQRGNQEQMQYGLKALQKMKPGTFKTIQALRAHVLDFAYKQAKTKFGKAKLKDITSFYKWIKFKAEFHEVKYHDLNAFCDLIAGEPYRAGLTPPEARKRALRRPKPPRFPLSHFPRIPLYAHDNHTWFGKGLIRRHPQQLKPQAKQKDIDLRWCGAYFGVCWRLLAYKQHGTVEVEWGDVNFPLSLHRIVSELWY